MPDEKPLGGPAFYAMRGAGWRDLVTVLHPPYTAWNLANVAIGAAVAPEVHAGRLWATLAAFFLAVGVSAHALDELNGRPLGTHLSDRALKGMAGASLAGALLIGVVGMFAISATLLPLVLVGGFIVVAYNLELFGGAFHTDFWLAAAWGSFPVLTSWWVNTLSFNDPDSVVSALLAAGGCFALTLAQRRLSTPVRELRRRTESVTGEQRLKDGTVIPITAERLAKPLDGALFAMACGMVALGAGLVILRV